MSDGSTSDAIDPKSTISYRGAKVAVIVLGVLLLLAFVMVVVGIGMRMSGHAPQNAAAGQFELPAGSKIERTDVAGSNLVLTVKTPGGDAIYIFNTSDGHLVSRIAPKVP